MTPCQIARAMKTTKLKPMRVPKMGPIVRHHLTMLPTMTMTTTGVKPKDVAAPAHRLQMPGLHGYYRFSVWCGDEADEKQHETQRLPCNPVNAKHVATAICSVQTGCMNKIM